MAIAARGITKQLEQLKQAKAQVELSGQEASISVTQAEASLSQSDPKEKQELVLASAFALQRQRRPALHSILSIDEQHELLTLLHELFRGYASVIKEINLNEVILTTGEKFAWRPPQGKALRTENNVLNTPSLIEQFLPIYIPGPDWQTHPDHDGHAGRLRELNFFKAIFGHSERGVKEKLVSIKWLEKSNENETASVTTALNIDKVFQALSAALEGLPNEMKSTFLKGIAGTFNWREIAGTSRLSAHSFGMTLDLNSVFCEYWLWDYKAEHGLPREAQIPEETIAQHDLPKWRSRVPFEIVDVFEKHGFMWGGKWAKYDTMHFEYRPECFVRPEVKQRIRQLLEKEGYELLPPLPPIQTVASAKPV